MKRIIVFDNGGETADRYTILDTKTGDYYGANENPFHPQGFGQYAGNTAHDYWFHAYGAMWRKHNEKKCIKFAVERFVNEATATPSWIGKPVEIKALPEPTQKYIAQIKA